MSLPISTFQGVTYIPKDEIPINLLFQAWIILFWTLILLAFWQYQDRLSLPSLIAKSVPTLIGEAIQVSKCACGESVLFAVLHLHQDAVK